MRIDDLGYPIIGRQARWTHARLWDHARRYLGVERLPVGLGDDLRVRFQGRLIDYRQDPQRLARMLDRYRKGVMYL